MKFNEAYLEMMKGSKITRPCFKGYWFFDGKLGKVTIHLENETEITKGDLTLNIHNIPFSKLFVAYLPFMSNLIFIFTIDSLCAFSFIFFVKHPHFQQVWVTTYQDKKNPSINKGIS